MQAAGLGGFMKKKLILLMSMTLIISMTACSHKKEMKKSKMDASASYTKPLTKKTLDKMTATWSESSKSAIESMSAKYGLPNAVTDDMVVWTSAAPFKRIVISKEEVDHQFPTQHSDILTQTINYQVPINKVVELAKFNGSLIVDRTKGEISARNENEEMNILSLNLADKIVRGEMKAEQARREYSKNAEAFASGQTSNLITSLNFRVQGVTADPDKAMQSEQERPNTFRKK
jgi:hypothetical protein